MRIRLELSSDELVRVSGPVTINVIEGSLMILGAELKAGMTVKIHQHRSYAAKAVTEKAVVDIELGESASLEKPASGEEPLPDWVKLVDELLDKGCKGFIVVGPVDAGKTSIAALIANRALVRGLRVGVVDADVGQADIGPPACVSAASVSSYVLWLRELKAEELRFIGSITPQRFEKRIVGSVVELAWRLRSRGVDVIVIDTDGWVTSLAALEYKSEMARLANIDAAICIGCEGVLVEMFTKLFSYLPCGSYIVQTPKVKKVRDREVRRLLRSEAYKRYLDNAVERVVDLTKTPILGSCLFAGRLYSREEIEQISRILGVKVLAASESMDSLNIIVEQYPRQQQLDELISKYAKHVYVHVKGEEANALIAVIGPSGKEEAIGIIKEIEYESMSMKILTPYQGEIKAIMLGNIKLSEDFEETGRTQRCLL